MRMLHEDVFIRYFQPYRHPKSSWDIWGGIGLETFDDDLDLVYKIHLGPGSQYLWTVVEEGGSQWIAPGYHWVNRICYLVTKVSHQNADFEFRCTFSSLTEIGFKRQIATIKKRLLAVPQLPEFDIVNGL